MITGLAETQAASGLTAAEFARAVGTSASRWSTYRSGRTVPAATFYLRALRIGAGLRAAGEAGRMTPPLTARVMREALERGGEIWAFKMAVQARDDVHELLDSSDAPPAVDAWDARPGSTGREEWDTLLAALIEHEFVDRGRRPPGWTAEYPQASADWLLENPFFDENEIREQTPEWLARRRIFVSERDLTTA